MRHESWVNSPFKGKTVIDNRITNSAVVNKKGAFFGFFGSKNYVLRNISAGENLGHDLWSRNNAEPELKILQDCGVKILPHSFAIVDQGTEKGVHIPRLVRVEPVIETRPILEAREEDRLALQIALVEYCTVKFQDSNPNAAVALNITDVNSYVYAISGIEPGIYLRSGRAGVHGMDSVARIEVVSHILDTIVQKMGNQLQTSWDSR